MSDVISDKSFDRSVVDLISSSETMHTGSCEAYNKSLAEICGILRIAKIEAVFFDTLNAGVIAPAAKKTIALYETEDFDEKRGYSVKKMTVEGNDMEYILYPRTGSPEWTDGEKDMIASFVSALFIITSRARIINVADRLSNYDSDFEVYTFRYLMKNMGMLFAKREIFGYCGCRFNLRRFSTVNARVGRECGTEVMKRFIYGLKELIGETGMICRLGGDNFIAVFRKEYLERVQDHLCGMAVKTDFRGLERVTVSAYAGYYIPNETCNSPAIFMDRLATALSMAKADPRLPYVVYDDAVKKKSDDRKAIESLFHDAIENEEFLVYYQPKVNMEEGMLSGAEALCRWKHNGELIQPFRFIPVLEMSNNICILDFYVLEHVCRDIRKWLDGGLNVVRVSVNLSRMHLGDETLCSHIAEIIDKYGVPHEYIEIELTETTTDVDFKELKNIVNSLSKNGIRTSVDDFGVGYSSLNLIRDLPWNVLKIDKSFLPENTDENKNAKQIMLKHVISMARSLGLECIVEGVETPDQVELLKASECYLAQGFYFDKPLHADAFEKRLAEKDRYKFRTDDEDIALFG